MLPKAAVPVGERQIHLSPAEIHALTDGRLTQIRRVVNPQPARRQGMTNARYCGHPHKWLPDGTISASDPAKEWRCHFGVRGDRLWACEPRAARRFTMDITCVRAQQLHDCSADDAEAFGLYRIEIGSGYQDVFSAVPTTWQQAVERELATYEDPRLAFRERWELDNGAGSWKLNPWIWVLSVGPAQVSA